MRRTLPVVAVAILVCLFFAAPSHAQSCAAIPPTLSFGPPEGICPLGEPGSASVDNAGSYTRFQWSVTNADILTATDMTYVSFRATSEQPVGVTVTVTDFAGCIATGSLLIPTRDLGSLTIDLSHSSGACPSETVTASIAPNGQPFSRWSWSISNGELLTPAESEVVSFRATGSAPVEISVAAIDNAGCVATGVRSMPVLSIATPLISTYPSAGLCPNGAEGSAYVDTAGTAVSTFSWSIANGVFTSMPNGQSVNYRATSDLPVQLSVTVGNASGCTATASATVPIASVPPPLVLTYPSSGVCPNGADGFAHVDNPNGIYSTYSWTITNGQLTSPANSQSVNYRATSDQPVQLSVVVGNAAGCTATGSATVGIATLAAPLVLTYPSSGVCPNGTDGFAHVDNPNSAYSSYSWTIANGQFTTPPNTQSVNYRATSDQPVQLTVVVGNTAGCTATGNATVPIATLATPLIITYPQGGLCPNGADGFAHVDNPNGAYSTYSWTIANGQFTTPPNTQSVNFRATSDQPVQLSVIAGNAAGCTATATATMPIATVNPPAITVYPASGVCTTCPAATAYAENPGTLFSTFSWSIANGTFTTPADQQSVQFLPNGDQPVIVSLIATTANGCVATSSTTVPIRAADAPVILGPPSGLCPGGAAEEARVESPETYTSFAWSITNGEFTDVNGYSVIRFRATTSQPVELTVTTRDLSGNTRSSSATLPVRTLPPPQLLLPPGGICMNGSSERASVGGAIAYTTYQWTISGGVFDGPSNSSEVTFHAIGATPVQLSVTVTDWQGCSATTTGSVPVRTLAPPQIQLPPGGICTNGGAERASVSGSTYSRYQWAISGGAFDGPSDMSEVSFHATGTTPVQLTVTVTDWQGCVATASASVPVRTLAPPEIQLPPSGVCTNGSTERASVRSATGYAAYQWTISGGAFDGPSDLSDVGFHATGATAVQLTVTVTDWQGCVATASATVPIRTLSAPEIQLPPYGVCTNGSPERASVIESTGSYASYLWTITGGTFDGPSDLREVGFRATGTEPVQLSVRVTDWQGCVATRSATVPVRTITAPIVQVGPFSTMCTNGAPYYASVSDPTGMYSSIVWSIVNGVFEGPITTGPQVSFRATTTNPVEITATATNWQGCSASQTRIVGIRTIADPTIFAPATVCLGGTASASMTHPGYATVAWTIANGQIVGAADAPQVSFVANAAGSVTLTASVTDNAGCVASRTVSIPVTSTIPPTIETLVPALCPNGAPGTSRVNSVYASYAWSIVNGSFTTPSNQQQVSYVATSAQPVQLTLVVTEASGCPATQTTTVPVNAPPDTTITPSGPTTFCEGGSVRLKATYGYAAYQWSNGSTSPFIDVTQSGSYSVMIATAEGCSATSAPMTVTVNPLPVATIAASGPTTFCAGGSVTLTASAGSSWLWSTGATTQSISVTTSGNYTVTVTDANGCSATSAPTTVTVNPMPAATITASGPTTFCEGASVTLAASDGTSWLWSNGATTQSITVNASGSYGVTITNASGCQATSAATSVTVNPLPVKTVSTPNGTQLCPGTTVRLMANHGGLQYLWSTGETTQSIVTGVAGTYTVTITNPTTGCAITSDPVQVTALNPPTPVIAADASTICRNGRTTVRFTNWMNFSNTYWIVEGGLELVGGNATMEVGPTSGSSTITVRVSALHNSCRVTSEPVYVQVSTPDAAIAVNGPTQFCAGGSTQLTAQTSVVNPTYLWSNGATTPSITVTESGSYTVRVTDAFACSVTSTATTITVDPPPVATITANGPTSFCEGGNVTLTASAGASWLWSNGATTQSITVDASGAYSVTVTGTNGCSATSAPTVVTENAPTPATITPSGPTTFCEGGSVTLNASEGASWLWSNGATTQSIAVDAAGAYSVTVTDASGCSAASTATNVTVNPLPIATITPSGPTTFCEGGSVTLTASGGASWLWSNGATTQSITVSTSGSHGVTVTDANGCSATSPATTVAVYPLPVATISPSGPTTFCEGGSITLTASAGTSWLWSNGATTQSIAVNASGAYSVTVTDASGCSATSTATNVTVHPLPIATITPSGPTTFCADGSVTLTASDGASWLWSNGATTRSITVSDSGSFHVVVTTAAGCSSQSPTTTVTENPLPSAAITTSGPTTFCEGGSVTLTASSGTSWLWSNGATTQSITVSASGSYSVTVTNANGCSATSAATTVTVNALPVATISPSGPTAFCEGGSVTVTASSGTSWLWSNGATTQSITVSAPGSYSVTVTNGSGCTATSGATTVAVNALPVATITPSGPTTFCEGGNVTLSASSGASWLWSNGATSQSITVNASGSYSVTVTDANGCSATSAATIVTVNALPVATITPNGPTTFCEGGSVTLTASSGTSWLWSNGATTQSITVSAPGSYSVAVINGSGCSAASGATTVAVNALPVATITPSGPTTFCEGGSVMLTASSGTSWLWSNGATTQSITVSASGTYSVTVTNANGCNATSPATTVTVHPLPAATITPNGPTTFCEGGSVTLTASSGTSWLWSNGATTQSITVSAPGSYSVTVTNANGCSATSTATTVTVNPLPVATISPSGPTTFCEGGSVTLTASSGTNWLWSNGATTQSITVNTAGSYSVTVTNSNGCSASSAATAVTVNPLPAATITPSGPTTFCEGRSVTLTASSGTSWLWSNGATTQSINVNAAGNYSVTVTNSNGCSTTSTATAVTVNPRPVVTITPSGPTTFCEGGSVTLTASGGASWFWSNEATTQSITVSASGTYSVYVTDANGCAANAASPVTVTVNPEPYFLQTSHTSRVCWNGQGWVETGAISTGAAASYVWSIVDGTIISGQGTARVDFRPTTTSNPVKVSVLATDTNGCPLSKEWIVAVSYPQPTITASGPTTFCQGGSVTLTANGFGPWYWSTGASTQSITVTASGSYTVTGTDLNGCGATSAPMTVTVLPIPADTITASGPTTFCEGGSVTLTASDGASWLWSNGATTRSINVSTSGAYSVTVTNTQGCSTTSPAATVTVQPATRITQPPQSATIPKNTTTTLTVSATGQGVLTYQWYAGLAGDNSQPLGTGSSYTTPVLHKGIYNYWVRVSGSCGVVDSSTATINAQ